MATITLPPSPRLNSAPVQAVPPADNPDGGGGSKPRFPRDLAWDVAFEVLKALTSGCTRIVFAGSLRRGATTVGDLEVLYVPRIGQGRSGELFEREVNLADECVAAMETARTMRRRLNVRRQETFGPVNKLMVHTLSDLPVDLFQATPENWANYLVCRTGPAASNTHIASAAQERGYRWNPYGAGFTRLSDGVEVPVTTEREVFEFVGLPYHPAHER